MVLPRRHAEQMVEVAANTRINPNLPTQGFITDFIESGKYADFLNYLCTLYRPKMDALNDALNAQFPGAFPVDIRGGFFSCIRLKTIKTDKEDLFIQSAKEAGVGIAAAWDAVAPNFREEKRKQGLFVRLTFPAFEPEQIKWGISKLKEVEDSLSSIL
jgi:DNA-binding transcriptional MocR family regulator